MPQNASDDTDRFLQAIAAFSAEDEPVDAQGRRIAATSATVMEGILTEVNETVLERVVHFANARGNVLSMSLSERRIHRLAALPQCLHDSHKDLVGKALTTEDAGDVFALLSAFAREADEVSVRTQLPQAGEKNHFAGVSIADLRKFQQNGNKAASAPLDVPAIIAAIRQDARAFYAKHASEPPLKDGGSEAIEKLELLSVRFRENSDNSPRVALWYGTWACDCAVLLACLGETQIAAALPQKVVWAQFSRLERALRATRM